MKLTNAEEKAQWLQCLQAAASGPWPHDADVFARDVAEEADRLFAEFMKRCEK